MKKSEKTFSYCDIIDTDIVDEIFHDIYPDLEDPNQELSDVWLNEAGGITALVLGLFNISFEEYIANFEKYNDAVAVTRQQLKEAIIKFINETATSLDEFLEENCMTPGSLTEEVCNIVNDNINEDDRITQFTASLTNILAESNITAIAI